VFIDLLKRFAREGRNVGDKPNSPNFAAAKFAKEAEARNSRLRKSDFETAMQRLFKAGKIQGEHCGRADRGATRIALK
jgi:hypothetical protein